MKSLSLLLLCGVTSVAIAHPHHTPNTPYTPNESFRVPSIATSGVGFNEEYRNRKIAEWSLQQVNASLPQLHDPWVNELLYRTTATMNGLARNQSLLAVPVINSRDINAFAVPGGLIAINAGVITHSKSLDETASVLAHEIAHLSLRHYERREDNKGKLLAWQLGGLLAAIATSAVSGDAAAAMMIGSQTMGAETTAMHSRSHEREADRVGMGLLVQAGFDAYAMPRFFETLQRQVGLNTSSQAFIPTFVQSHPLTLERLGEANARAGTYPIKMGRTDNYAMLFDLLYWRIKYLAQDVKEEELRQSAKTSQGAMLALVAYLADKRRFDEAQTLMDTLAVQDEPLYCITQGHIYYEKGDFDKAVEALTPCQAVYPERRDVAVYLADSLVFAGRSSEAVALLLPLVQKNDHDVLAWDLLQKAYENLAKTQTAEAKDLSTARALQARGHKELWRGQYDNALKSLTQAQTFAKTNALLTAELDKNLQKVKDFQGFKPK